MMPLKGYQSASLIALLLLLLPQDAIGSRRPWSVPQSRVPLLRHDFSLAGGASPSTTAVIMGLKGGETAPSTPDSTTEDKKAKKGAVSSTNMYENMARGGSTTAAKRDLKRPPEQTGESEAHVSIASVANNGTMNAPVVSSSVAVMKQLNLEENKEVAPKKLKFHKRIAKKLKNRNATNLRRKVMHASFGFFFAGLNHFIPKHTFVPGMAILSGATLLMELLRYRKHFGWMNHALHFVLGDALRKHEMDGKFTGSFYFFTGVTLTAALFPTSCATMGIIQLAVADPSASYFGRATRDVYWSRIENGLGGFGRNKGILGFLGGALSCVPFNYHILSMAKFGAEGIPGGQASLALASLALGVAGAFADLAVPTPALTLPKKVCGVRVPPLHLDDNFVVPLFSGFACTQVFKALAWQQNLELARFLIV